MQQDDIELHKEYQQLAISTYKESKNKLTKDWIELDFKENKKTGFQATSYYKNNKIVIAISGSNDFVDYVNSDFQIAKGQIPEQMTDARIFHESIKNKFPNSEIIFIGHSLGGRLAQLMSNETGCNAVTFNAYGTKNLIGKENIKKTNIINYGNQSDFVFRKNLDNQLGKTYIIPENKQISNIALKTKTSKPTKKYFTKYHSIETMGNLEDAKEYKQALTGYVSKNIGEPNLDVNRIYTRNGINNMHYEEFSKKENIIFHQMKTFGIPTEHEAQEEVKNGNLIWVNSYVRNDGTQVHGYYRRK